ncbi:hypothetical protein EC840_105377 [Rahnella sp. JUb53]|nr:hypothetical protein EC840_105377 [Rahnella sp. JUb53]
MIDRISALSSAFFNLFFRSSRSLFSDFSRIKAKKNGSLSYRLCVRTF